MGMLSYKLGVCLVGTLFLWGCGQLLGEDSFVLSAVEAGGSPSLSAAGGTAASCAGAAGAQAAGSGGMPRVGKGEEGGFPGSHEILPIPEDAAVSGGGSLNSTEQPLVVPGSAGGRNPMGRGGTGGQTMVEAAFRTAGVQDASCSTDLDCAKAFSCLGRRCTRHCASDWDCSEAPAASCWRSRSSDSADSEGVCLEEVFFQSVDTPMAISDASERGAVGSVTSSVVVLDERRPQHLVVSVSIDHPACGDLGLVLRSPRGRLSRLISFQGADADDCFPLTQFTDIGSQPASELAPPYLGDIQPEDPLDALVGADPCGTWTLSITDGLPGLSGTLLGWSLVVYY